MTDILPPLIVLSALDDPSLLLIGFMVGMLLGLAPFAVSEWLEKRRARREQAERERRELDLATDFLMLVGFLEDEQAQRLQDDTQ